MSLTINLEKIDWKTAQQDTDYSGFSTLNVHVAKETTGLAYSIDGKLLVSQKGLVYSHTPNTTLWFKFLALASVLTATEIISKCNTLVKSIIGHKRTSHAIKEEDHTAKLASIARHAVVYKDGFRLMKRVEEFALAEINYNKGRHSLIEELNKTRVQRFTGSYAALCMQPLFHVDQTAIPNSELAQRCNKYAVKAILNQNGCLTRKITEMTVETQREIECCDIMCYKQQKVCGLLYKIDCCALRCWAADLGCFFCCFWPAGNTGCII